MDNQGIIQTNEIERRIVIVRNRPVLMDADLADMYGVEIRALNQAVKRNIKRFPEHFMFQLTKEEQEQYDSFRSQNGFVPNLKSQFVISSSELNESSAIITQKKWGGKRSLSYAFTQQGTAMLSTVLHSDTAIDVSIRIMDAFVKMYGFLHNNAKIFMEINDIKKHLLESDIHHMENDKRIERLFSLMDKTDQEISQGIFYDGQIFDSYMFIIDLIKKAKTGIILIDNYVDETVLTMLDNRNDNVSATIYTAHFGDKLKLALTKHNSQYSPINIEYYDKSHDRFLIIDDTVYHIGASLKDLGKSVFAFSRMCFSKEEILKRF